MLNTTTKTQVLNRLSRLEGQVAAIRRMIEDDKYCVDTLLQISAVQGALGKIGQIVLGSHIETCVASAFASGNAQKRSEKIEELMEVFSRYGRVSR